MEVVNARFKADPRKIIAVQKHVLSLQNNAHERMCIYPIFHLALEKVKWKGGTLFTFSYYSSCDQQCAFGLFRTE